MNLSEIEFHWSEIEVHLSERVTFRLMSNWILLKWSLNFSGNQFDLSEIEFHLSEIEFHLSKIQFHLSEIDFHWNSNFT